MKRSAIRAAQQRLNYASRRNSTVYAELVTEASKKVPIIELTDPSNPALPSSPAPRFAPETLQGKSTGHQLLIMPKQLTDVVSHHTWNVSPAKMRVNAASYYQDLPLQGHRPSDTVLDVETHMTGVFLQNYASCHNILSELKRHTLDADWTPSRVLDIGFGPATGMVAFNEVYGSTTKSEDKNLRKISTIMGHDSMKKRARALLKAQNDEVTAIMDQLPGNEASTNQFDLIIATHQLGNNMEKHLELMVSLLDTNGMLILIEKGDPIGFEVIARARQILLRPENSDDPSKTPRPFQDAHLKILAPCPHHGKCPLQVGLDVREAGKNPGWFNWCRFGQMIQRPKFAQELKKGAVLSQEWTEEGVGAGGKTMSGSGRPGGRSYETAGHSYLIVRKVDPKTYKLDAQDVNSARILRTPMKRDKHVTMEVCSPSSHIEHWTVSASYGKQAYHDARKADGGDLWRLGAKSIQQRGGNTQKLEKLTKNNKLVRKKAKPGRLESEAEEKAWNRRVRQDRKRIDGEMTDLYEIFQEYQPGKE